MSTPIENSQALYFDDITREEVPKCSRADCIHHPASAVGIDRMDFQTVMRTTKGLYIYLCDTCGQQALHEQGVVVAYDHDNQKFAKVVAAVFSSKNVKVHFILKASPLTSFLVKRDDYLCGVQISATSGYKIYSSGGAQILPCIEKLILDRVDSTPWEESLDDTADGNLCSDDDIVVSYTDQISRELCRYFVLNSKCKLRFVYNTTMHGLVGLQLLSKFGFPKNSVVERENSDDVDYIINNNSDDTVFTVSEKQQNGSWFNFSGDEVGLLLGDWQLLMARNRGVPAENCLLLSTIFSSRMLAGLCRYYCCRYVETLPGFNHLTSTSIKLVNDDPDWVHCLAYDESNEFALTLTVPDSDGVSAAAVWCEMANFWRVNKKITMKQRLDQLQQTIGYYVRDNGYYYNPHHSTELGKIFEDLRSGGKYMDILGNSKISHVRDFTRGIDTRGSSGKSSFPVVSECDIITLYFANGLAVTLRSCGKKLEYFSEMRSVESVGIAQKELMAVMKDMEEFFEERYGLEKKL